MLSQAVLIAAVIDLIGVNIRGGGWGVEGRRSGLCKVTLLCTQASHFAFPFCFPDGDRQKAQRNFSSNYALPVTRGE